MRILKRLSMFLALFLSYIIIRELLGLYVLTSSVSPTLGYITLLAIIVFLSYFVGAPIYRILKIPANLSPSPDLDRVDEFAVERIRNFKNNPYLLSNNFDFKTIDSDKNGYDQIIKFITPESERIRKRYVLQLFYSSSVSQNGFLDAILILSSSVNLVKELFILYHGRVSNKDIWAIACKVYFSMAIGGTEGVEYASEQIFSKFASNSIKSIPFADKIFGSLADGFVNAAMLTRISLITENYCKLLTLSSEKNLYPSSEAIMKTTQFITSDIFDKMTGEMIRISKEKTYDYMMFAVNPVAHLFNQTINKVSKGTGKITAYPIGVLKDIAEIANKPFIYGVDKVASVFRKTNDGDKSESV